MSRPAPAVHPHAEQTIVCDGGHLVGLEAGLRHQQLAGIGGLEEQAELLGQAVYRHDAAADAKRGIGAM